MKGIGNKFYVLLAMLLHILTSFTNARFLPLGRSLSNFHSRRNLDKRAPNLIFNGDWQHAGGGENEYFTEREGTDFQPITDPEQRVREEFDAAIAMAQIVTEWFDAIPDDAARRTMPEFGMWFDPAANLDNIRGKF